jgi:hypothetical protein
MLALATYLVGRNATFLEFLRVKERADHCCLEEFGAWRVKI